MVNGGMGILREWWWWWRRSVGFYLMDELSNVSWVGCSRAEGVLVLVMEGPLIQPPNPHLHALRLQSIRLLQLTQIVVLVTQKRHKKGGVLFCFFTVRKQKEKKPLNQMIQLTVDYL